MREIVCIVCPNSCRMQVAEKDGQFTVTGNECKRGIAHGIQEWSSPERMLSTTVVMQGGTLPRLPVVSTRDVPKALLRDCLAALYQVVVSAPVTCGDVVVENICGTGIDVVASRSMAVKS